MDLGDRPSARCIPSHDRHDLMNITEAMPGCQSSFCRQRSNIAICIQKVSCPEKCRLDRKPAGAGTGEGNDQRGGGGLAFVSSQSVSLTHTHKHTHTPVCHPAPAYWCPNSHRSCRSAMKKGKSSPQPRLLTYSYTCRLGLQECDSSQSKKLLLLELPGR